MPHTSLKESQAAFEQALTVAEQASWVPVPFDRPEKGDGGRRFELVSDYKPAGNQPQVIMKTLVLDSRYLQDRIDRHAGADIEKVELVRQPAQV